MALTIVHARSELHTFYTSPWNKLLSLFNFDFFSFHPQDLILRGDVGFGATEQFQNEAKMAVRLANFISAFLQV